MRTFLYIISAIFMLNSIVLIFRKSFTLGLAILICISAGRFILGRYLDFWLYITDSGIGYMLKMVFLLGISCFMLLTGYVLSFAHTTATWDESAVIVLGCGLEEDGTPAPTLRNRLDGCVEYFNRNSDCFIVVTGGYSRHRNETESAAMKKYLTEKGIPAHRILTDDQEVNTRENFENYMDLLTANGIYVDNVCYITNSFHIYRRSVYARQSGFWGIKAVSVKTDRAVFIPAVLREVCGVAMMMFFGY